MVCCCVGSVASGKTVLLTKLRELNGQRLDAIATIPTVGVNHFDVPVSSASAPSKPKKKACVSVRELGGELAQNWPLYLGETRDLIYVIDLSNHNSISEVGFHLLRLLKHLEKASSSSLASVLLVYSKTDLVADLPNVLRKFDYILRLGHIKTWYRGRVEFEEVPYSAVTEDGIPTIKDWLRRRKTDGSS